MTQCYLNGEFLPLAQARISPLDRGFLFGDGVYEVIPVYRRRLFYRRRHLARLAASLEKIRLPFDVEQLAAPMQRLVDAQPQPEQAVYIQITRGEMAQRLLPAAPGGAATVFMMSSARAPVPPVKVSAGIRCCTAADIRWARCDIKSISLLASVLLAPAADGADDEVIIIRNGLLSEGSRSNFIMIKDGVLHTPVADNRMLSGITYQAVVQVAAACGIRAVARDIPAAELLTADEIWLTSTTREMLPVVSVDDTPVGDGVPGALFRRVYAAWQAYIAGDDWANE